MLASTAMSLGSLGSCLVNVPTHSSLLLQSLQLLASANTIVKPCSWKLRSPIKTVVAAVNSSEPAEKQATERKTYYFLVANTKFMLDEEEHFQEQLFERLRLYGERNKKSRISGL